MPRPVPSFCLYSLDRALKRGWAAGGGPQTAEQNSTGDTSAKMVRLRSRSRSRALPILSLSRALSPFSLVSSALLLSLLLRLLARFARPLPRFIAWIIDVLPSFALFLASNSRCAVSFPSVSRSRILRSRTHTYSRSPCAHARASFVFARRFRRARARFSLRPPF